MIINHVMSNTVYSGIFNSIIGYFKSYSDEDVLIIESVKPIENADVYHYHRPNLENDILYNSVMTVHHDLEDNDSWFVMDNFIEKYKKAKKIVCLNTIQEKILRKRGIYHTVVIPHGYNDEIFFPKRLNFNSERKIKILITSKRYGRRVKGEGYLLELIKYLDPNCVEFILVGEGRLQDREMFDKFGFQTKIYEYLPYSMFGNLYNSIDFLMMTSFYEGGPANIPEAIASGTPIICNPIGMARDMVEDGFNGIYLTMNVENDQERLNNIFYNHNQVVRYLNNASSKKSIKKAITWRESIHRNNLIYKELAE